MAKRKTPEDTPAVEEQKDTEATVPVTEEQKDTEATVASLEVTDAVTDTPARITVLPNGFKRIDW